MAELPDWQPLDGAAPPISAAVDGVGRVVAVVATERAVADGWAPSAALDLARGWSTQGARVMLIDCGLDGPTLHLTAGVPNREGLTDATFHGASVARVARPLDEGAFYLVTGGSPVADAASVARSPRWHRLSSGMTEAGVTVALYVRAGDACAASFLGSASDIVVLAPRGEPAPGVIRDLEPLVRGVTAPADAAGPEGGTRPSRAGPRHSAVRPTAGSSGAGRMIVLVILAVVVAALLGIALTSVLR
jgi:hypothetical protein